MEIRYSPKNEMGVCEEKLLYSGVFAGTKFCRAVPREYKVFLLFFKRYSK